MFEQTGNRDNKLRARMKWLVDTLGFEELQRRVLKDPPLPARLVDAGRAASPRSSQKEGDAPAGVAADVDAHRRSARARRSRSRGTEPYERWERGQRRARRGQGHRVGLRLRPLGDITVRPVPGARLDPARARRRGAASPTARTSSSAASPRSSCRRSSPGSSAIGMAEPGAELARDVVACPGADTCNLAVTQSRGLADAIGAALEEAGLAEVGGVRINISGCTNSCGQHHIADIGFFGAERRAHGQSAPGYQMLLGGYVGQEQIHFGEKALRLPAKNAPEAAVRVVAPVRRRARGRRGLPRLDRPRRRRQGASPTTLKDLDEFPTPEEAPEFYVDYGETGPYVAEIGESECAT